MDLFTLMGLLGETPDSDRARPVLNHFPVLHTTVSALSNSAGTLTETFLSCREHGFEAKLASTGEIMAVYLMGQGNVGFSEFPYPLLDGLCFGARREDVESRLGHAQWSRSSTDIPVIRNAAGEIIRYDLDRCMLYFQFDERDGRLQQAAAESILNCAFHFC